MIVRLKRGSETLDLNNSIYSAGLGDFRPPSFSESYSLASGTIQNKYGGSDLVLASAQNREWEIEILIRGTSAEAIERSVRRLSSFVRDFEKESTPVYLEVGSSDISAPLWGQFGSPRRYEIVSAVVSLGRGYSDLNLRSAGYSVILKMSIKPHALGSPQNVSAASGAILEDIYGSSDLLSRGVRVLPAVTNKMTNPVFSHATYNNTWTAAANLVEVQNTDRNRTFPGVLNSPLITSRNTTSNTYTQSINVGSTATHYFAILVSRPDGEEVTTSDCQIYYNSAARTTTFRDLGNGLYLGTASTAGVNSSTATGIIVYNGRSVILQGMYCGTSDINWIPMGDLLGASWSSTAHASTSTTTAGKMTLTVQEKTFRIGSWAIAFAWKPDFASTNSSDRYLFALSASAYCYYAASTDDFRLTDGTNTADTATASFSAGDELLVIASAGPSGLAIYYYNLTTGQALSATNGTYTTPANPSSIYIGSNTSTASHCDGIIRSFQVYGSELSASEVGDIYTAISPDLLAGNRPSSIPWLWTSNNDGYVENALDTSGSTGAPHYNYAVLHGVDGDSPPLTTLLIIQSNSVSATIYTYISNIDSVAFIPPSYFYNEIGTGSDTADTSASGGYYTYASYTGLGADYPSSAKEFTDYRYLTIQDRFLYGFARLRSSGSYAVTVDLNNNVTGETTDTRSYTLETTFKLLRTHPTYVTIADPAKPPPTLSVDYSVNLGTTQNVGFDFALWMPSPVTRIISSRYGFLITEDGEAMQLTSSYLQSSITDLGGDPFTVYPNRYNTMLVAISEDDSHSIDKISVFSYFLITPRWTLL